MFGIFVNDRKARAQGAELTKVPITARDLPDEVLRFLSLRDELNTPHLSINVLDEQASAKRSSALQGISVCRRLRLFALDDAEDSNPYCYIGAGVAAGMVVHFNHDPEPRIEFETLDDFEHFLRQLRSSDQPLNDGDVDMPSPAHPNQIALAAVLSELSRGEDDDSEFLICLYLPLLRGEHRALLRELATHTSFFVREVLAEVIGTARLPGAQALLRALANDPDPQVRDAAHRASRQIEQSSVRS